MLPKSVRGSASLFCPQPAQDDPYLGAEETFVDGVDGCTNKGAIGDAEDAADVDEDVGALTKVILASPHALNLLSAQRRMAAELSAQRRLAAQLRMSDEKEKQADETSEQADEPAKLADETSEQADETSKQADEKEKQADEKVTQADEPAKLADEPVVLSDEEEEADENAIRRALKQADIDFPVPWQERGDTVTVTKSLPKRKLESTKLHQKRKLDAVETSGDDDGTAQWLAANEAGGSLDEKPQWTRAQWANWKTSDDAWFVAGTDTAASSSSKLSWDEELASARMRWHLEGRAQAGSKHRGTKRRGGKAEQERRAASASSVETVQALKRACERIASADDLDLLYRTYGPKVLSELVDTND